MARGPSGARLPACPEGTSGQGRIPVARCGRYPPG
ncbi:hypothetical protein STIAU_5652, partial [Stigmatella aurantiaca DW4/3-1]